MGLIGFIKKFLNKNAFNPKWKCLVCGKEIFDGGNFCSDCKAKLPFNDKSICDHCGRELTVPQSYCTTCKGELLSTDFMRSAFSYKPPISSLIKDLKYFNKRYLAIAFSEYLADIYFKNFITADYITCVPMTENAYRKRGFNQSELMAKGVAEKVGVPYANLLYKKNETQRQAKLDKAQRLRNLKDAFRVISKPQVKGKTIVIIDDVATTGATGEAVASKLKSAGAEKVILLTVASVPPKNGY